MENKVWINKYLGITSIDVENETDSSKILEWYESLLEKNRQLKGRKKIRYKEFLETKSEESERAYIHISDLINDNKSFLSILYKKRNNFKIERSLTHSMHFEELKCFRQIAKRALSEELYEHIKMKARRMAEENLSE
ncbi:hypothetical protein [Bacteroides sp.]|uniref:hypothetical protein n=1 Tax=Bacteroides sp. TaxID=29523 RepID=UPI0025B96F9A|nr:hypothetical protein [Bacteroides sp.]